MKLKPKMLLAVLLLSIILLIVLSVASAVHALEVTNVTRITHPYFSIEDSNEWTTLRYPWNADNTRLIIYEMPSATINGETGRGLVWGNISDLKSANGGGGMTYNGSVSSYKAAAKVIPTNTTWTHPAKAASWSPWSNETNIIYAAAKSGGQCTYLKKINVDTSSVTDWVSISGFGNCENMYCFGYDVNKNLICSINDESWGTVIKIDVINRTAQLITSGLWDWSINPPIGSHGHGDVSPDKLYRAANYGGDPAGVYTQGDATFYEDTNSVRPTHVDWQSSNDWYIGARPRRASYLSSPNQDYHDFYQIFFNRSTHAFTYYLIYSLQTAGWWETYQGAQDKYNLSAMAFINTSNDGLQLKFQSTNGKQSYDDYIDYGQYHGWSYSCCNDWSAVGVFLADIGLTCTSFTYSDWSACQPDNTQTRTVVSSYPVGCSGGTPILSQSCVYTAYTIIRAPSTPVIDGAITEFSTANEISLTGGGGGTTAKVKMMWDDTNLYLAYTVLDTQLNGSIVTRDGSVWTEDSVEWFIDKSKDDGGSSDIANPYMLVDDFHGIVNIKNTQYDSRGVTLTPTTPDATWNGTWTSAVVTTGTINNNSDTDTGYVVEIAIPWTTLGYGSAPTGGTTLGIAVMVNDEDASEAMVSFGWPEGLANHAAENASLWSSGILQLVSNPSIYNIVDMVNFTGTANTELHSYNASFIHHASGSTNLILSDNNRLRTYDNSGSALYYYNVVPPSSDYAICEDLYVYTNPTNENSIYVTGREHISDYTFYGFGYFKDASYAQFRLIERLTGTYYTLQSSNTTLTIGNTYTICLVMLGTTIKGFVDGIEITSQTNSDITSVNKPGLRNYTDYIPSNSTGYHVDNYYAQTLPVFYNIRKKSLIMNMNR